MPETEPETPMSPRDGEDEGRERSRRPWRWIIPLIGILAVAASIWIIFLPPGTSDAAAEAVCVTTARLGLTLESRPAVTTDSPVADLETWLPVIGNQVVIVADLARSIRMNIDELAAAYDALGSEVRSLDGATVGSSVADVDARVEELARAVDSMSAAAKC